MWHDCTQRAASSASFSRAFITLTTTTTLPPGRCAAPRCRWSLLSCRAQSIERARNGECPPISSFRLNVVQVLPVQLERDLHRIETGPRTYGLSMLAFSTLDAIHQINDLEWLCAGVKKKNCISSFRARTAVQSLNCRKERLAGGKTLSAFLRRKMQFYWKLCFSKYAFVLFKFCNIQGTKVSDIISIFFFLFNT